MGNTQPHNKTGRKVVEQKLENARKTGVLSLSEHKLEACPSPVFDIPKLTTLDLSKNKLKKLDPNLSNLKVLKSLNVDHNKLTPGSLNAIQSLPKLKSLSASHNLLGKRISVTPSSPSKPAPKPIDPSNALPKTLPKGLKTILLSSNGFRVIPTSLFESPLKMLEKLDLSKNQLATLPESISSLVKLNDLNLDDNDLESLPSSVGTLKYLKVLSLRNNQIANTKPQPLSKELWTDTPLIDLNLHGNPMTTTQLNTFEGYESFLKRRREVKNKDILGGAMVDLEGCGLE
eukprot:CAMPEP_0116089658 /NCGR_PEP_ID=MMETSP0327-20121206/6539_1 /TAXON_ID=44447 /ORGANISM="Pseudo-nitzschia delicatissima, Strain B596" /LENGTH=287 /DNA_ID=CAMNT_0003580857 /DNA_START=304 /DNA_END=1167 /DNA_ORIENTATION=-